LRRKPRGICRQGKRVRKREAGVLDVDDIGEEEGDVESLRRALAIRIGLIDPSDCTSGMRIEPVLASDGVG